MSLYISLLLLINALTAPTPLLPEIEKFTQASVINEQQMEQNAYVYLMALDAVDDNYFEIGKRVILQNNKVIREAIKEHDQSIIENDRDNPLYQYEKLARDWVVNNKRYKYECYELDNKNCVNDVLKDSKSISILLDKNKKLLKRYEQVIQQPNYDSYLPMTMNVLIPDFSILMMFSSLRQAQAIQVINQGNISQGLIILQQEINFSKRILSSNAGLIDKMVAFRLLLAQYHTVEVLLDYPSIKKHLTDAQLTALLVPLTTKEQQGIANALEHEFYFLMTRFQTISVNPFESLLFNRKQTINNSFLMAQPIIKQARVTLPEAKKTYQELLNYRAPQPLCENDQITCIFKIYQRYGINLLGGILLEVGKPSYKEYIFRLYGLQSYLALIEVKLLIKQQHIAKEQIPTFLESLGDKANNPYTGQPFKWDDATSSLSTDSISSSLILSSDSKDKDRISVSIIFN